MSNNNTQNFRLTVDEIQKHIRCLEALIEDVEHNSFMPLIMSKFCKGIVQKIEEKIGSEKITVKRLRDILKLIKPPAFNLHKMEVILTS